MVVDKKIVDSLPDSELLEKWRRLRTYFQPDSLRLGLAVLLDFDFLRVFEKPPQAAFFSFLPGLDRSREVLCAKQQDSGYIAQWPALLGY